MKQAHSAIEMAALKRAEHLYRTRLANQPDDCAARVKLAWCLFMQALYRAGQESMLKALFSTEEESLTHHARIRNVWEQDANDLLQDCLFQTGMVMQLTSDPQCRAEIQRLEALVKLIGCEQAVAYAHENSSRVLGEMLQEVF